MATTTHARALRAFNRTWTQRIGILTDRYLGTDRPLGEARLLREVGAAGAELSELRARLGLDSGYLSRLLRALEADDLVEVGPRADDRRARVARLTSAGRTALTEQERRADRAADAMLAGLDDGQRETLVASLDRAQRLMRLASIEIAAVDPASAAAHRCLGAYAEELRGRFPEGYDDGDLLAPQDMTPPAGLLLVAFEGEAPVGCAALRRTPTDGVAEVRHMWVDPHARAVGLGRRLLRSVEERAPSLGARVLQLGTHEVLAEAQHLYRTAGWTATASAGSRTDTAHEHVFYEKHVAARLQDQTSW